MFVVFQDEERREFGRIGRYNGRARKSGLRDLETEKLPTVGIYDAEVKL